VPLTQADLQGQGGVVPPVVRTVISPEEQSQQAKDAIAAQVKAASELPESAATKALLGLLGDTTGKANAYRVAVGNAMEVAADLETHLLSVRQKMLAARMTEADADMRSRLQTLVPSVNGVLMRFEQMHRTLSEIEDGLSQISAANTQALAWATETGYIQSSAS
jgi:hypothetical protein